MSSRNARPPRGGAADVTASAPGRGRARTLAALVVVPPGVALVSYHFVGDWVHSGPHNGAAGPHAEAVAAAAP